MTDQPAEFPIGQALRLIRVRVGGNQADVERRGGPNFWTLERWEKGTEIPTLSQVAQYLTALRLGFHDLQDALDQIAQRPGTLYRRLADVERRLSVLERGDDD